MSTVDLSERELAILRGIAAGRTLRQIARDLGRAYATVEPSYWRLLSQLGARTDAQAVDIGHRMGLLGDPRPLAADPAFSPARIRRVFDPPDLTARRRRELNEAMAPRLRKAA